MTRYPRAAQPEAAFVLPHSTECICFLWMAPFSLFSLFVHLIFCWAQSHMRYRFTLGLDRNIQHQSRSLSSEAIPGTFFPSVGRDPWRPRQLTALPSSASMVQLARPSAELLIACFQKYQAHMQDLICGKPEASAAWKGPLFQPRE